MRSSLVYTALWGLVVAFPRPQEIDIEFVVDQPDPTYTIDVIAAASQVVSYDQTSVLAQVTDAVSSMSIAETDVATSVPMATVDAAASMSLAKGTASACASLNPGATGAPVLTTDDPLSFVSSPAFASAALKAVTPQGYANTFTNLNASALSVLSNFPSYIYITDMEQLLRFLGLLLPGQVRYTDMLAEL